MAGENQEQVCDRANTFSPVTGCGISASHSDPFWLRGTLMPAEVPEVKRIGNGRYPFRVRMRYFFPFSPTTLTLISRHPRFEFGRG